MTNKEIQELIKLVNKTDVSELKLKDGNFEISIRTKEFFRSKSVSFETPQILPMAQPVATAAPVPASAPAPVAASQPVAETQTEENSASNQNLIEIKSPIVGTFYRSSSPDKPAYAKVGDDITSGDVVCIVEAMKLFNEIESEISGKIVKVMVEDATPVEYDQVLFLVEPA